MTDTNTNINPVISFTCNGGRCRFEINVKQFIDDGTITSIKKMISYMNEDPEALEELHDCFQAVYLPLIHENDDEKSPRYRSLNRTELNKLLKTAKALGIDTKRESVKSCGTGEYFVSERGGVKTVKGSLVTYGGLMYGISTEPFGNGKRYRITELLTGLSVDSGIEIQAEAFQTIEKLSEQVTKAVKAEKSRALITAIYKAATENAWTSTTKARAYITKHYEEDEEMKQVEELTAKIAELEKELARKDEVIEALRKEKEHAEQAAANEKAADPKTKTEEIAKQLSGLDGITVNVKGTQTSAPVIWITGDTKKHKDAITAAGGKWSGKRGAWYIKAA